MKFSQLKELFRPAIAKTAFGEENITAREDWLKSTLLALPRGAEILDAGAGTCRYRRYCEHLRYTAQDFAQYDGKGDGVGLQTGEFDQTQLDLVSDITAIPVESASFDAVMCIEVLEHVPAPVDALREMIRILRPGGTLILTAPTCSLTHFAPYFFQTGYSRYFYEHWLMQFGCEIEEISANGTWFSWMAQELRRLPQLSRQARGHGGVEWLRRKAIAVIIDWLAELERETARPADLLSFGYHVKARKRS